MSSWWTKGTRRLGAVRQLRTPRDVVLFLQIFCFALAVPVLLRLKLSHVETLIASKTAPPFPDAARIQKIVHYVDVASRVGKPLVRPGCLTRGLTLYHFLRRAGLDVSLCFGMGNLNDEFVGHCWLVKEGEPFLEAQDPRPLFTAVYSFPTEIRVTESDDQWVRT